LVLRGARQVGKTLLARQFAKENFNRLLEINFDHKRSSKEQSIILKPIRMIFQNIENASIRKETGRSFIGFQYW
jgi:predicted AAA+ superfamily ATPase